MYRYRARVERVVDGDTVDMLVDLGFDVHVRERLRLYGVDTPETRTRDEEERKAGIKAKEYVEEMIGGREVEISTEEKGKFGRYLAIVYVDGLNLNRELIGRGMAREYFGEKKKGWNDS